MQKEVAYGTAGFRGPAVEMEEVVYRCGLMAALLAEKRGQAVGVCITASHNPAEDNGVKLIDSDGAMMSRKYEEIVTSLVNAKEGLPAAVKAARKSFDLSDQFASTSHVLIGRDTRASSPDFAILCAEAATRLGAKVTDLGESTTPLVHYFVLATNDPSWPQPDIWTPKALRSVFIERVATGARKFLRYRFGADSFGESLTVAVDAAYGVGFELTNDMVPFMKEIGVKLSTFNGPRKGCSVNDGCGSEFVQKRQLPARGSFFFQKEWPKMLFVSFDGDADRIVGWTHRAGGKDVDVLDGDAIAILMIKAILKIIETIEVDSENHQKGPPLRLGLVLTAYSNGSAIAEAEALAKMTTGSSATLDVRFAPTGVKFIHEVAAEYDIGLYFEANGHGTVIQNHKKTNEWKARRQRSGAELAQLDAFLAIFHPTVGCAVSDLVALCCALKALKMQPPTWRESLKYRPCVQRTVPADATRRARLVTEKPAESRLTAPLDLQEEIDGMVAKVPAGRAFVRPSGTEAIVRVYAEAETKAEAEQLCGAVSKLLVDRL